MAVILYGSSRLLRRGGSCRRDRFVGGGGLCDRNRGFVRNGLMVISKPGVDAFRRRRSSSAIPSLVDRRVAGAGRRGNGLRFCGSGCRRTGGLAYCGRSRSGLFSRLPTGGLRRQLTGDSSHKQKRASKATHITNNEARVWRQSTFNPTPVPVTQKVTKGILCRNQ